MMELHMETLGTDLTKQGFSPDLADEPEPGQIMISVLSGYGDIKKVWNAANNDEVEDARRSFDHLVKQKKYLAFRVSANGDKSTEQIREFDPTAGKMILVPPVAGG
jgi:hypothetical protein